MIRLRMKRCEWLKYSGLLSIILLVLTISCATQQNLRGESPDNFEELKALVNSGDYEIENQWAVPLNGSMIDLIGNTNRIRFEADSIKIYLPYFGVKHSGVDYGGRDGGIKYEGTVEDLDIQEDPVKERINIEFKVSKDNESFDFRIVLFSNGNANTSVNSSARNSISYRGIVRSLPENKK
ncbi:DUF4251 domain-containing protein [Salinimicrobium gaetbulicola]|uniref:DUF4251 domain-containing protein n=1 Tax=Salinimicrobium gaetbulicola TaxID=999702 RepID=A0ABW3ICH5_9FLAO